MIGAKCSGQLVVGELCRPRLTDVVSGETCRPSMPYTNEGAGGRQDRKISGDGESVAVNVAYIAKNRDKSAW
jgi:hypothetical protein